LWAANFEKKKSFNENNLIIAKMVKVHYGKYLGCVTINHTWANWPTNDTLNSRALSKWIWHLDLGQQDLI
jgi:hypothetical protein